MRKSTETSTRKEFQQIRHHLTDKITELEYWKEKIESSLNLAPEGALVLSKSNGLTQYFHKTNPSQNKGEYIEKKNQKLISVLAQKDYEQRLLKEITKQISQLKAMVKHIPSASLADVYSNLPEQRKELVIPYFLSDEEYVKQWMAVPYEGKTISEDQPFYITEKAEKVRSKIEKILADKLFLMEIPYRYEYPLNLKGYGTVYPDFTLLNTSKREEIYLEHFGMMDSPQYAQKAIQKLHTYAKNGIYPGKNLIVTFETLQMPLDMRWVEKMILELLNV